MTASGQREGTEAICPPGVPKVPGGCHVGIP
jgi:hypothetical protein